MLKQLKAMQAALEEAGFFQVVAKLTYNYLETYDVSIELDYTTKSGVYRSPYYHHASFHGSEDEIQDLLDQAAAWVASQEPREAQERRQAIKAYSDAVATLKALGVDLDGLLIAA